MRSDANPYDAVAYPSVIFRQSHPERLASVARLHGLDPPSIDTARVLEVGGGDGLQTIALAAAYPRGKFVNFDLAVDPVARGRRWTEAAGLTNVRHLVLDILDAPEELDDQFDYIVAHGIYAWVPDAVRAGVMRLLGRLLSPGGVAFVSYNALPGGYARLALRDLLLHELAAIDDPIDRLAGARRLLTRFAPAQADDSPIVGAMRREAAAALTRREHQLFHDELNPYYAPQRLSDVVAAANANGLRYLGEVGRGSREWGFVPPDRGDVSDAALVRALQAHDLRSGRAFRTSLFVRDGQPVSRTLRYEAAADMWVSTQARRSRDDTYSVGSLVSPIVDERGRAVLNRVIAASPGRLKAAEVAEGDELRLLIELAIVGFVDLHTAPPPFTMVAGARPEASPLARAQLLADEGSVATLDHRMIVVEDAALRHAIPLLDGRRDRQELERVWNSQRQPTMPPMAHVVETAARGALLRA